MPWQNSLKEEEEEEKVKKANKGSKKIVGPNPMNQIAPGVKNWQFSGN